MKRERSRLRELGQSLAKFPKTILGVLVVLVVLLLAYLIGANWFLNSEWGKAKLNRKPEKLSMQWQRAWTWWPGVIEVAGLKLEGHNRRADWSASVEDGKVWIWLPSLIGKHVNILRFPGQGAEIEVALLPPPDSPPPAKKKRGWRITLDSLRIDHLRRFKFAPYELTGDGNLHGQVNFRVRESMQFDFRKLSFNQALLTAAGETAAEGITLEASASIDQFAVGSDTIKDLLASLTAEFLLQAESAHLGFLDVYLATVPMLRVDGQGPLTLNIAVNEGLLSPDSQFRLEGPIVSVDYAGLRAVGNGSVVGSVLAETNNTQMLATLETFSVFRSVDMATLAQGQKLQAKILNDSIAIDQPASGIAIEIELPPAHVPNLAAFDAYVPASTGLTVTGGEATFAAQLSYDSVSQSGTGSLALSGDAMQAAFSDLQLTASTDLKAVFPIVEMDEGRVGISGTELNISDVVIRRGAQVRDRGWWGHFRVAEGDVRWTPQLLANLPVLGDPSKGQDSPTGKNSDLVIEVSTPGVEGSVEASAGEMAKNTSDGERSTLVEQLRQSALIEASISADLRDTGPVTALIQQRAPKLSWIDGVLTVENVSVTADVRLQEADVSLHDLRLIGGRKGRLEILGQLELHEKEEEGVVFARFGPLSAAVKLDPGERDWKLTKSRAWYDQQVVSLAHRQ